LFLIVKKYIRNGIGKTKNKMNSGIGQKWILKEFNISPKYKINIA
jgi:hypothetical protein